MWRLKFGIRHVDKSDVPDNTDPQSDSGNFPFEAHDYLVSYDCYYQFGDPYTPNSWHANAVYEIKDRVVDAYNSWGD